MWYDQEKVKSTFGYDISHTIHTEVKTDIKKFTTERNLETSSEDSQFIAYIYELLLNEKAERNLCSEKTEKKLSESIVEVVDLNDVSEENLSHETSMTQMSSATIYQSLKKPLVMTQIQKRTKSRIARIICV